MKFLGNMDKPRTLKQNSAFWLWCELLAKDLNEAGFSVTQVLKHDAEIPWTKSLIHELLFKSLIKPMYGKTSTTQLTTKELSEASEVLIRHLGEKLHIETNFPSLEELALKDLTK